MQGLRFRGLEELRAEYEAEQIERMVDEQQLLERLGRMVIEVE